MFRRLLSVPSFLCHVGPGVVTLAADDDPSGIAIYTQAGRSLEYWSAVINGVVAVSIMVGLTLLASKQEVMGKFTSGIKTCWFGWGGVAVMGFAVVMLAGVVRQIFGTT